MDNMTTPPNYEQLAAALAQHPDYRVITRFSPENMMKAVPIPAGAGIGLVVDTETTGRDDSDKIIELGMVAFAYDKVTGQVYGTLDTFNELEDPGMPIDPAATAVNGITDEMVAGKRIDDDRVSAMVELADFCVAHNSSFDRPKCEARFPVFKDKAWACSFRQLDWAGEGVGSAKLDYIAYTRGFFFEAHRAHIDCLALLNVLSMPMAVLEGKTALAGLLACYKEESHRIWAVNSPFDTKDDLKARGYRWSDGSKPGTEKAWHRDVSAADLQAECAWLKENVYGNRNFALPIDQHDAFTRFSDRNGTRKRHIL